jgi:endonuclease/exonuclease/phosphatase family metal-dependent hydrolase
MRIISWNINKGNIFAHKAIIAALKEKPDILCLQEVSLNALDFIKKIPGYSVTASYDFLSKNPKKHGYTVTLSKFPVLDVLEIPYDNQGNTSLLDRIVYKLINKSVEQHNAIIVTMQTNTTPLRVVNTRLSCAVNSRNRILEFKTLISRVPQDISVIYCGDFNVVDSPLFNRLTGWLRGFKKIDYRIDEREEFEKLFERIHCVNIFKGLSTHVIKYPLLQFDHILIPNTMKLIHKVVSKNHYGSDHKMLLADVLVP